MCFLLIFLEETNVQYFRINAIFFGKNYRNIYDFIYQYQANYTKTSLKKANLSKFLLVFDLYLK